jgi:hypothetical protein
VRKALSELGVLVAAVVMMSPIAAVAWFVVIEPMIGGAGSLEDDYSQPARIDVRRPTSKPNPAPVQSWTCDYHPTMNGDWHDDILCSNGLSTRRPYLLGDDPFVTHAELMQAADRHEVALNGRR